MKIYERIKEFLENKYGASAVEGLKESEKLHD